MRFHKDEVSELRDHVETKKNAGETHPPVEQDHDADIPVGDTGLKIFRLGSKANIDHSRHLETSASA